MATTLMTKSTIPYCLGLKERRDASSAGPPRVSLRQARRFLGALNTAPCTIVSCCQMSRCHKVLSRLPQVLQRLWPTGLTTYLALACTTLTCRMSCAHLRSSNQTSKSSLPSLISMGPLKEPCQHACLKHPYRTLEPEPFLSGNPIVQRPRLQGDAGVLPTISSEEPFLLVLHVPQAYAEMPVGTIERRQAGKATFRCDPFIQLLLPCLIEQYHARRLQH